MIVALIPAYNAQRTIADVIVRAKPFVDQVFVFDDGSSDHTYDIASELGAVVFRNEENRGKGFALRELFAKVSNLRDQPSVVVTLDSDGQHFPEEIPQVVKPILAGECDVVVGTRDRKNIPFHRLAGNVVLDLLSGSGAETLSGFRAYSPECLRCVKVDVDGYGADTQILSHLKNIGKRVLHVPIGIVYDEESHKKNLLIQFYEIFKTLFLKSPLRNLGLVGFVGFMLGLIELVNVVLVWNRTFELALGTLLFSMILLVLGALTFFVGVIVHVIKGEMKT